MENPDKGENKKAPDDPVQHPPTPPDEEINLATESDHPAEPQAQPYAPPTPVVSTFNNPVAPAAPMSSPAPVSGTQPSPAAPHPTDAVTIILQWLTYAFWGWTVLVLSVLTASVFNQLITGTDSSNFNYYIISAALVLLPISLLCDFLYSKKEPPKKAGPALIVMVIHAVIFALFGIGALIFAIFSLVSLLTSTGTGSHGSTAAGLYSSLIITVFYATTFVRTLNPDPAKLSWIPKAYKIFMLVFVGIFIILGFTKPTLHTDPTVKSSSGEQLNTQGTRRPVQYLHICDTAGGIEYVSQGTPKCLGSDTYQSDYDPSVAGTVYSSPCKTTSGKLRYIYISNDEACPGGTSLLFYNSLGGSTSGPVNPQPSAPITTTPSSSAGEQVNTQGTRRPVQYLHICDTAGSIEYVSQGTPKCLGNDVFQSDYDPSVAGTVFSSPCKTNSGTLRYVYISNDEVCPAGTTLLFYDSLGGSTSGPAATTTN